MKKITSTELTCSTLKGKWEDSYKNYGNFVFYPCEEVIRFVSKYLKKRIGINEFTEIKRSEKCLDLGSGIGRHVLYLNDIGYDAYGIELSEEAVVFAKKWFKSCGKENLAEKFTIGSATDMPYENDFFDFIVSHGVLDSMYFEIAQKIVEEAYRVTKNEGLFYLDLISGNDHVHGREYCEEKIVDIAHEQGTVQSYFNWAKINRLLHNKFAILEATLIRREGIMEPCVYARYHIIAKKI